MVIKQTGRNEDGITLDRDTVWQEFFKSIGTDEDNRELRQSITAASELNYWRNTGDSTDLDTGGDNTEDTRGDVEGEEADAQNSSTLVRCILVDCDFTNLN